MTRPRRRDLFTLLAEDHRQILALSEALSHAPPGPAPPVRRWRALAQRLVMEVSRHEVADEQFLWPLVRDTADSGRRLAIDGVRQEQRGKRRLRALERAAERALPLGTAAAEVVTDLAEHVSFEETAVMPALREVVGDELADAVGLSWARARATGPTRPRPYLPAVPGLLRLTGGPLGRLDRVRDVLAFRGR